MSNIFALIKSLSPSEKRYFKLFAQRQVQQKSTNYAQLFDAINEQESYNEEALLKKFKNKTFVKQFGVTKHYLFQMILSCMQAYNEENYIEWKIRNQYLQIKILASKGLDAEAEKLIKKTKELAWQYEFYYVIADILIIEKYLFGNFRIGEPTIESYTAMDKEEAQAFEISMTHQQIGNMWHYLTLLELEANFLPVSVIHRRADSYVAHLSMQQEPAISYNAKFRYYSTWSLYYNLIQNQQKNYECCKQALHIREEQIIKQPMLNMDPLASYYNFLIACEKANRWDEFEIYLEKIKQYQAPTIEINIRQMHNYCWCGLMYHLHQQQYKKAIAIIDSYKSFFIDKKIEFRKDFKIYIEAACGLVCLFNKDYKQAMYWWNTIINNPVPNIELRVQGAVRLYVLMLHFEEKNNDILSYVAQQAKNYLQENGLMGEPEKLFIKQLCTLAGKANKKDRKDGMQNLLEQIQKHSLSTSYNALNTFIMNWMKTV